MVNEYDPPENIAYPDARRGFWRRHWLAVLLSVLAVVGLIALIFYQQTKTKPANTGGRGGPGGPGGAGGPVAVAVASASRGDIQLKIPALGTVTSFATVTVRTQISGIMQRITFTEGQMVRQGELLAIIDPRPYAAALEQAKGNLRRDQALLADAKLDETRYEGLVKEDSIAEQTLDTQHALVHQYEGTIQSDEGAVRTAEVNLAYTHIVSPVTGRVGIRQVDQGNYVTPGDSNGIVVVNQVQPISVLFSIPEDYVSRLAHQVNAGVTMPVEAFDRTNSAKIADGKLLTLDNAIDVSTGTVKLRAQFDNNDGLLFPNQFVNISLLEEVLHDQIVMPNAAVRRGAPNGVVSTFVYIVNSDSTVSVRPVTLGVVDGETVAVASGLAAGDMVVTEGGDRLRDGATVLLPNAKSAQPPASKPPGQRPPGGKGGHRQRPRNNNAS